MSKGRILSVAAAVALAGSLSACDSSKTPAATPAASATATATAPTSTPATTSPTSPASASTPAQPAASSTSAAFDLNSLNTAALPTPALLPMNDVFQWDYPSGIYDATAKPDQNGGVYWQSACLDAPTVPAKGWKGSQQTFSFTPKKNFTPSGHAPGFDASWNATATVFSFADAQSAATTATGIGTANDDCLSRLSGFQHLPDVSVKRVATTPDGQSWSVTAGGSKPLEVHYYLVHRGSFIVTVSVAKVATWSGTIPAYTGAADGSTDTTLLTDMATKLCGYAGACS